MDRTQAIEKADFFRIGATILDANTREEKEFTSPRVTYYARKNEDSSVASYHKKVHPHELVPSISRAKHYVRENKLRVVAAKDRTDEIHMRMLVADRQKKVVVL
jgi:hypothetical protein